jgi:hypothetical protein
MLSLQQVSVAQPTPAGYRPALSVRAWLLRDKPQASARDARIDTAQLKASRSRYSQAIRISRASDIRPPYGIIAAIQLQTMWTLSPIARFNSRSALP